MKTIAVIVLLALAAGCGGASRIVVRDVIQIRPLLADDPLATKFDAKDGSTVGCGDPVLTDQLISYTYFKKTADSASFDLYVVMTERGAAQWKTYTRRTGKTAAFLLDGRMLLSFPAEAAADKAAIKVVIASAAASQEEADALQLRLDKKKSTK
ncbi:MAG: hypothetical protein IPP94_15610 [Ignavibacteria bacterium]|nr:hypothetical protein [Ignavibacteria bacterium]